MKKFSTELCKIARYSEAIEAQRDFAPGESPMKECAYHFLFDLKLSLQRAAKDKKYQFAALEVGSSHVEALDSFEKQIFQGCVSLGLETEIKELFVRNGEDKCSIGYYIFVKWSPH